MKLNNVVFIAERNTLHVFRNIDSCQCGVGSDSSGEAEKYKKLKKQKSVYGFESPNVYYVEQIENSLSK